MDDHGVTAGLDAYDPATDTWRTLAPMPTPGTAVGTVLDHKLYVLTGDRHTYAYDPVTNTWKTRAPVPAVATPQAAARIVLNGRAFLFAAGAGSTPSELYTP